MTLFSKQWSVNRMTFFQLIIIQDKNNIKISENIVKIIIR